MRRFMIIFLPAILALFLLPMMYHSNTPTQSHAEPIVSATPTLPRCLHEDGAGMALCTWDAQQQGNGRGTSLISGDCAPSYVGGEAISALCVKVHKLASVTTHNADGSSYTRPNGADLVAECNDIKNVSDSDPTMAIELANDGWTLEECYKVMLGE